MKYCSTRGTRDISFKEAALSGWCDHDGGMFLPQDIPLIGAAELEQWRDLSYADLAVELLHRFIAEEEISHSNLRVIVQKAVAPFALKEVIALHPLNEDGTLLVCDLWNGPSLAFKDLGMSILCGILDHFLEEDDARMNILVGTSGDTGPSALVAIKDKPRLSLVVLYPQGRVSDAQELQMLHTERQSDGHLKNLRVVAVEGTSDDLDRPIEVILQNPELRVQHKLGSVNSVNIVRMLAQMIHFFWCYFRAVPAGSREGVSFAIPTGAAGHATSCLLAKLAGLPINKILVANNQNDVLAAMLNQRVVRRLEEVHMTCAPAMDIQVPYNVERMFFLATAGDSAPIAELMAALRSGSHVDVPDAIAEYFVSHGFIAAVTSDAAAKHTMQQTAAQGRLQDPHTSVGVHAALEAVVRDASVLPMVCMGCAHPVKFLTTVGEAINGADGQNGSATPAALDLGVVSLLPDADTNTHVSELLALLQEKATAGAASLSPQLVFHHGEDWVHGLLEVLKNLE